ncbi:lamina-associated polypeptide 2, isoforms beta/gamma-like isoform X1 [Xiphophorus maculatus]|uniref:LEM domain containing 1 n=1 Tax=Xiphophorus maculatus TaxID=8083 RepID=A0A3B5QMX9_XIPMA|nr:lamina-associated polypeptide 2, isoforms beta/gamma-like isoform X1 [Xiphophorus maculatus]
MPFVEDPACLSKSRLKSDLVAHNVELPPAGSKKEAYVALHLRHVDQTNAADFSSDDDQEHNVAGGDPEGAKELDPSALTDKDLKALLFKYGVKAGPILASTRAVYEKKLRKLLQSAGEGESNEADNAVLYSDSDEEDVSEKDEEKELEGEQEKKSEALELNQQQCNEDPVKDILKDLLPDTKTSPTGIYATPRRPIKGAAQQPIQYAYPDTPVSPTTLERQEVARRLAPVYVQVLVFFAVMCILFFIFVNVENTNSVVSLLERQNQRPDGEEGIPALDETQDAACGEL